MRERLEGLGLPVGAALCGVGGVLAVLDQIGPALLLALAGLGLGLADLHLRLGAMASSAARAEEHLELLGATTRGTSRVVRRQVRRVRHDLQRTRKHLDQLPSDTAYLQRLLNEVADPTTPLPPLGGWAATARSVLAIADEIRLRPGPVTVLDCGSGASTVLAALLLRARGHGGHVYALESDLAFAEETRGRLRAHGVADLGTVVDAPLADVTLPDGGSARWYDLSGLRDVGEIDVLFVDGPIGTVADQARYPAFPMLAGRLADGALVIVDDTNRPDEKAIVRRWLESEHDGRALTLEGVQGRATLLRASKV
jgi:predicted O-methyltransferase YrrM